FLADNFLIGRWGFHPILRFCFGLLRSSRRGCSRGTDLPFLLYGFGIALLDHVPKNLFGNLEYTVEFAHRLRGQNHINEYIKAIAVTLDGVCQATPPPLIDSNDLAAMISDDLLDTT